VLNPDVSGKPEDYLNDDKNMPWATESHRCAKVYGLGINGGEVLQWPEKERPTPRNTAPRAPSQEQKGPPKGAQLLKDGRYYRPPPR
jgi:hypothetical protein